MKQILLLSLILTCSMSQAIQRTQLQMGTFGTISLKKESQHEISQGFKLLKEIELSLSSYNKKALLYKLNQYKKVKANNYLLESIHRSQELYTKSNGFFDISIGSVTKKLYNFGEEEQIPSQEALRNASTNINGIHIKDNIISLDKNITLDLGGMGKGFGVDKVGNYYREQNISHGIIALSGDIQVLHPTSVYLDSPFHEKTFAELKILQPNTSISTSGTYRRYVKTQKHHHLINPKTKMQGKSFVSITLITKQNNTLIDAMATAIGVMSVKEALHFLVTNPHIAYILVRPNGNVLYGNLEKLVHVLWL
ncbi:MAG: Thiamin biosynthesis lipoprotein ApbE [uncultured Sulfurovum sp.]|uniref:FAD:protein FMN transferase n=1 Tax=uncultured Sulfurovum sp. TaxID=269237 RepID=A0A6S6S6Q4_9BACT|nr:MAG: Thiamin biosynthesis lipoprotein ApbE [uncultured Sulfurovum sp.]